MRPARSLAAAVAALPLLGGCSVAKTPKQPTTVHESASIQRARQVFARIAPTLARNHKTFEGPTGAISGFGAGDAYPQIWLRDSSWIVDAAAAYYPREALTSWLDLHLANAEEGGRLRDWVAKGAADNFREWAPRVQQKDGISFDTNSNESDQEPSAALAHCRTERLLGPETGFDLDARRLRLNKLISALDALIRDRADPKTGLIWSGLTADWGDVSPLYPDQRAIYRDARTPRTISLYSNVMAYAALDCLSTLAGSKARQDELTAQSTRLRKRIRSAFWMEDRGFFRIRLALDAAPPGFSDDGERFALGGNALAALFGVADDAQAAAIFKTAERLRVAQNLDTISATLLPPYASGVFQHPTMREPFQYQNGGEWDWFGAALVLAEFERGFSESARVHLDQIASRILAAGPGLHEWYGQDGSPKGSSAYAAAAAAYYNVMVKGLLGVSRSSAGYRVVIRTGETLLPFTLELRAAGHRLVISQSVSGNVIEARVLGHGPIASLCSVIPEGRTPADLTAPDLAMPQTIQRLGADTIICADTSRAPQPLAVRFVLSSPPKPRN
ncbi:MAG: hypothetical protein JJE39_16945 [Vicinamibacteria bacterium]|nr:hypothetical protein [Vicinamibacteria bacterium]